MQHIKKHLLTITTIVCTLASAKLYYSAKAAWQDHWTRYNQCMGDIRGIDAYHSMLENFQAPMEEVIKHPKKMAKLREAGNLKR